MKSILQIFLFLLVANNCFNQNKNTFPNSFIGHWKGELQWIINGKPTQTFTMLLRIQSTDSANQYTWQIVYGDDNKDNRPYILKPVDTAKGHWIVDENDGIVLCFRQLCAW